MRLHLLADIRGRDVVVVGCGPAGAEKIARLAAAGAAVVAIDPAPVLLAASPGVVRVQRPFEPTDVEGVWLVVAATDDEAVNDAVAVASERAGVWVTRADRPDGGALAFAAAIDRGPVQVGVSTGGLSPSLAVWIRERIAQAVPASVATMAELLSEVPRREGRRGHGAIDFDEVLAVIDAGDLSAARALLER